MSVHILFYICGVGVLGIWVWVRLWLRVVYHTILYLIWNSNSDAPCLRILTAVEEGGYSGIPRYLRTCLSVRLAVCAYLHLARYLLLAYRLEILEKINTTGRMQRAYINLSFPINGILPYFIAGNIR